MAIAYLTNIDLNNNQLKDFKVDNVTSDPTGLAGEGQFIYRTDTNVLKYHTGSNTWVQVGTSVDAWTLTGDSGPAQTISNNDTVFISGGTYISTVASATDTLKIAHDTTSRTDTTSAASPAHGATFTAVDSVTTNSTGHVSAINVKTVTLPNDNDTSLPIKNSAGTLQFTADDTNGIRFGGAGGASVTFNSATQLVTISSADNNETYTLPVAAGAANSAILNLTAGGTGTGIKSSVTLNGTTNEIAITETAGNNGQVTIGLPDDVTITDQLTVTGILDVNSTSPSFFTGQVRIPVTPLDVADAASKQYVDNAIANTGQFQGGYNAATNTPDLDSSPATDIQQGWMWAVTVGGTFFTEAVTPGDFIFANQDNPGAVFANWTVVQSGADIATAGATDGATDKGITGFDSANFTVTANGWTQLIDRSVAGTKGTASKVATITTDAQGIVTAASNTDIAITASQVTDFCTAVQVCVADNSDAVLIGNGTATSYLITHNYGTRQIAVQCARTTTPWDTVMLDVERTTTNTITLTTSTALPSNGVEVFLQKIV
tara:strand:- start:26 stop:1666 length:1641 start_codon:yes stop_codon:yes gene_type:complete